MFYVDANGERRNAKDIVRAVRQFADAHKPDAVGFETDQFQQLIADQMQADVPDMLKQWKVLQMPTGGKAKRSAFCGSRPTLRSGDSSFAKRPAAGCWLTSSWTFPRPITMIFPTCSNSVCASLIIYLELERSSSCPPPPTCARR